MKQGLLLALAFSLALSAAITATSAHAASPTYIDFAACPMVSGTSYPAPMVGPNAFNCGSPVTTPGEPNDPNPGNDSPTGYLGCFPSGANPLGAWIHDVNGLGQVVAGTVTIVTAGTGGTFTNTTAMGPSSLLTPLNSDNSGNGQTVPDGNYTVTVTFQPSDSATYVSSMSSGRLQVGNCAPAPPPFPAFGDFVIGNGSATPGGTAYFWGSQWSPSNVLTRGSAPNDFKGFENTQPMGCGQTWTATPGNSTTPPITVPPLMTVTISSHITRSGSTISGDVAGFATVQTAPGYQPDPGHPGTGTIMSVFLCAP